MNREKKAEQAYFTIKGKEEQTESREKGKVILDVHIGTFPLGALGNREVSKDDKYIGIEPDESKLTTAGFHLENMHEGKELNLVLVNARGEQMPVKDSSVDEVLFRNVLGNPSTFDFSKFRMGGEETYDEYQRERQEQVQRLVKESKRVLKQGGKIIIAETVTPSEAQLCTSFFTEDDELKVTKFTNSPEEIAEYAHGKIGLQAAEDSFVLELQKKRKSSEYSPVLH